MVDNQNAIKVSENPIIHEWTKHIVIKHHIIIWQSSRRQNPNVLNVSSIDYIIDMLLDL
jgi:hypothetical protein